MEEENNINNEILEKRKGIRIKKESDDNETNDQKNINNRKIKNKKINAPPII